MSKRGIGNYGEQVAYTYLKTQGYKIFDRNWYCQGGEIDIICFKDQLVFVEVKYVNGDFCTPYDQMTYKKIQKLLRAIRNYLNMYPKYISNWRLDLIAIQRINGENDLTHHKSINLM